PRVAEPSRAAPPTARPERPYVDRDGRWLGHEGGPRDERYRADRPWPHGRFAGPIGAGHLHRLSGWDIGRHRFWFGTSLFLVGSADWNNVDDWDWNDDDVVLYDDPDHPGWYLAYNTRLGTYVHVEYDGPTQQ
ncbi:MAG: hypothetical protein JWN44_3167, partial [Myxococcales bacterium]|nr:hypothetical protein [Myxococcales bacterium]